jgi:hypothetical protein
MITHYTREDAAFEIAYCGRRLRDDDRHSPFPTCGTCAAILADECALDEAIDETPFPLDADEAALALDPVLNAGVPVPQPAPSADFATYLYELVVDLNRVYTQQARQRRGGRR